MNLETCLLKMGDILFEMHAHLFCKYPLMKSIALLSLSKVLLYAMTLMNDNI